MTEGEKPQRYYLAGPMSGHPQFNFPAFDFAASGLRAQGYDIISPAELDAPEMREAVMKSPDGKAFTGAWSWGECLARDLKIVADNVTNIILMPGWEKSRGARLEAFAAILCGHAVWTLELGERGLRIARQDANYVKLAIQLEPPLRAPKAAVAAQPPGPPHDAATTRLPRRRGSLMDLIEHLARQIEFSERVFGPANHRGRFDPSGVIDHIRKELTEIEAKPTDLEEWIDVVILALDGAWRAGYTPAQIAAALHAKQLKNESRRWPDWRTAEPGKAIEHIRENL